MRAALTIIALAVLAMLGWWARRRRPAFDFQGFKYKSRPLRRSEFCISPFPPAQRWRGQSRSYRDHLGQPLWSF
jgi:hypothetical protein